MEEKHCCFCNKVFINLQKNCGKPEFNKRKFCSSSCYSKNKIKPLTKCICKKCKKVEFRKPCRVKNYRYCSIRCAMLGKTSWRKGIGKTKILNCLVCKNKFTIPDTLTYKNRKFCSQECYLIVNKERVRKLGLKNNKYRSEEQIRQDNLKAGRKSYRKHIKTRSIYYRQLNFRRRNIKGSFTVDQWEDIKKLHNNCCNNCKLSEPFIGQRTQYLTIDHIVPIKKWNKYKKEHPEVLYECNDIENIQPLCLKCNCSKRDSF